VGARQHFYLDRAAVAEALSLSESTVEKLVRENEFPKPRILSGRRVAWLVREVEEWAEARPVSDLLPPENTGRRRPSASLPIAPASHQAS
jgi:prophage regulatory protein